MDDRFALQDRRPRGDAAADFLFEGVERAPLLGHPLDKGADQRIAIKQQLREAFYIDADDWKQQILAQSFAAAREGVAGLVSR